MGSCTWVLLLLTTSFVRVTFRRFLKYLILPYYIRKKTEWGHRTLNMKGTMTTGKFNSLVNRKGELNGSYRIWWISIYYKSFDKLKEQKHCNRPVTSLGVQGVRTHPPFFFACQLMGRPAVNVCTDKRKTIRFFHLSIPTTPTPNPE